MTAKRIDGKATATTVKAELAQRVSNLVAAGYRPGLATVLIGEDPASQLYVAGKHRDCAEIGIQSIRVDLPADTSAAQAMEAIQSLNENPACTGYIVQLPVPKHLDEFALLSAIDPAKDADGLSPANLGNLVLNRAGTVPCTPAAVLELLRRYEIPTQAHVVVVGRGTTVGRPIGLMLTDKSVNATVTLCHTGTKNLADFTRQADIVVAAAGRPGLITADMVKAGSALFDVGISRIDGKPVGDLAPDVWEKAAYVTPNPGGVGPMTRAMLLANVVSAAERLVA